MIGNDLVLSMLDDVVLIHGVFDKPIARSAIPIGWFAAFLPSRN